MKPFHSAFCAPAFPLFPHFVRLSASSSRRYVIRCALPSQSSSSSSSIGRRALLFAALLSSTSAANVASAAVNGQRVADFGRLLGRGERDRLEEILLAIETTNNLRIRVITVVNAGDAASSAGKFPPGECDVLLVADTRGGNLLYTRVGDSVYTRLPRSFWIELPNRFGTQFYVRDNGADGAIFASINAIAECSTGNRMCGSVPGVSSDQLGVSVVCSALAGSIFAAAARTEGKSFNVPWVVLFSPLWSIFLVSFGLGPVLTRVEGPVHFETALVSAAFLVVAAAIWFWIPRGIGPPPKREGKM